MVGDAGTTSVERSPCSRRRWRWVGWSAIASRHDRHDCCALCWLSIRSYAHWRSARLPRSCPRDCDQPRQPCGPVSAFSANRRAQHHRKPLAPTRRSYPCAAKLTATRRNSRRSSRSTGADGRPLSGPRRGHAGAGARGEHVGVSAGYPAGAQFSRWLEAFNSGNRETLPRQRAN
jgi:hypothetical protein